MPTVRAVRPTRRAAAILLAFALVTGCGGGGGGGGDAGNALSATLGTDTAQGYAADAATAPVTTAGGVDAATALLEVAVARRAGASGVSLTVPCAGGGSVSWTVTGGGSGHPLDGRLDAGETYQATYSGCGDGQSTTDGSLTLVVVANDASGSDFAVTASSLTTVTPQGRSTIEGGLRQRRSVTALSGGGTRTRWTFTATAVSTTTVGGAGTSRYELRTLDWTVDRSSDASGAATTRSHQGTLVLVATPARRSPTTLEVATQGAMAIGSDGYAEVGSLAVVTADGDRVTVAWGISFVGLALDLGNDGRVDARWTLRRADFYDSAG